MCCVPQKKERHRCRRVARLFAVAFFDSWSSGFLLSGSRRTRFSQGESATVSVLSRRCRDSSFFDELVFLPTAFFACFFRPICGVCRTPYPILLCTGSQKRVEGEGGRSCVPAASAVLRFFGVCSVARPTQPWLVCNSLQGGTRSGSGSVGGVEARAKHYKKSGQSMRQQQIVGKGLKQPHCCEARSMLHRWHYYNSF